MVNTEKCLILSHVLHIVEAIEIIIWVIMGLVIVGSVFPAGSAPKSDNIFLSALIGSTVLGFYILFVAIFSIFAVAYKRRMLLKISAVLVFIMMVLMEYSTHSILTMVLTIMICNDDREW